MLLLILISPDIVFSKNGKAPPPVTTNNTEVGAFICQQDLAQVKLQEFVVDLGATGALQSLSSEVAVSNQKKESEIVVEGKTSFIMEKSWTKDYININSLAMNNMIEAKLVDQPTIVEGSCVQKSVVVSLNNTTNMDRYRGLMTANTNII